MTTSIDPVHAPLSALLREGSKAEHEDAENSGFMTELLGGRVDRGGYGRYLASLRPVYVTLEEVGRELRADPVAGAVVDPDLERLAAIDADLAFWAPDAPTSEQSPAVADYVAALEATRTDPRKYIAHHYTRYLGDLSGGQAIGRILSRTYGLESADGVRFYDFVAVPKPKPYKDAYRARLDALPLDEADRLVVLDEVKHAFDLNGALFRELGRTILGRTSA